MIFLFLKQALRDQYRKIYIFYTCILESFIQVCLDIFPKRIAVRQIIQTSLYA